VHRWINAISGLPGGWDVQELRDRHMPPESDPGLHLVGDYLFDCTINGVFDSAEYVSEAILSEWRQRVYNEMAEETTPALARPTVEAGPLGGDYFDYYDGERPYEESFEEHFDETYTIDLIRTIFHRSPPYRLLDCGSANGLTLQRFARKKVDAWGIEYSPYIYARTPEHGAHETSMGTCAICRSTTGSSILFMRRAYATCRKRISTLRSRNCSVFAALACFSVR
jgi:hypothetical protein